jgi:hypothetical protein
LDLVLVLVLVFGKGITRRSMENDDLDDLYAFSGGVFLVVRDYLLEMY